MWNKNMLVVCAGVMYALLVADMANAAGPKGLAAKVNGVGIKTISVDVAVNNFIENQRIFGITVKEEDKAKLRKDILDQLIAAELLYQKSQTVGLGNLNKSIDDELANIKSGFGSEEEFNKTLKERGITLEDLKEDIKKGVYINAYLEKEVFHKVPEVTEEEKIKEYENNKDRLNIPEEVRASHILIRVDKKAGEVERRSAMDKIRMIRERALAGEDFANLARDNSQDVSAKNGGDVGYFRRGEMVKPFEDAAFSLEENQISDVVETEFGYHILKVLDKRPARVLTYEEVKDDITKFLDTKKKREIINKIVEDLKKGAKIEVY